MNTHQSEKIPVGISACLLGEEVRLNGGHKLHSCIDKTLGAFFSFRFFCPEVDIGLGIPRRLIPLIRRDGVGIFAARLMQSFPELPAEEEGRLGDAVLRENFIQRVYIMYRWRQLLTEGVTIAADCAGDLAKPPLPPTPE